MILWFAACAVMGTWLVLHDQSFDYRLVAAGALAPDVLDAPLHHRGPVHTLAFAVGVLVVVMLTTTNRRPLRKRLIAIPVGLLAHLVLDAVFAQQALFWWPAFGSYGSHAIAPPVVVLVVRELIGLVVAVNVVRRFGLRDGERRRAFMATGTLTPC
ncbi:MAG: hypothetical protein QOJ00_1071 [Actinomycetota bacterium]